MELKPLNYEESWVLLLKLVNRPSLLLRNDASYEHLKKIVMLKCKGFSMAISLLSGVLYNKQLSEWEEAMEDVTSTEDETQVVSNMLTFSFHVLHPVLKACLIYMILFPEHLDIPVRRLLRLWLAEGFFNTQITIPAEDIAEICLEELINTRLVEVTKWKLDGSPKTCRMPRLIRDLLRGGESVQAWLYGSSVSPSKSRRTASVKLKSRRFAEDSSHGTNNSLLDQNNKHLHSYLSFNTHIRGTADTEIGNFLKELIRKSSFALLRVLDLEGVYKPELPNTIGTLALLKFLGLRLTVLDSIPESICKLPLLETLDLKRTNVSILPSSIWKSKSLRHLYVNEVRLDGSIQQTISNKTSLTNFQTIRGLYIVDDRVVSSVLERFVNLRKLGIKCHEDSIDQVIAWISQLSQLQTLKLKSVDRLGKPHHISTKLKLKKIIKLYMLGKLEKPVDLVKSLPSCLRKLTLSSSQIEEDAMVVLGDLPELLILRLLADSYKSSRMTCSTGKFPKLLALKLWMLPELEVLKVEKGAMLCLKELEIRKCEKTNIYGLEHLKQLDELVLTNMTQNNFAQSIKDICRKCNIYIKENDWKFSYYQDETS